MKPGRGPNNTPACCVFFFCFLNNQETWFRRKSEELNLNVSDKSLVDRYISVFLVND